MTAPSWSDAKWVDQVNEKLGVNLEPSRLSGTRFAGICRRAAEWNMIDPETLNVEAGQEAFRDLRAAVNLLIADSMARSFWRRLRARIFG